jgi:hypothetical protein
MKNSPQKWRRSEGFAAKLVCGALTLAQLPLARCSSRALRSPTDTLNGTVR